MYKPEVLSIKIRKLQRKQNQMENEMRKLREDLNDKLQPLSDIRDILEVSLRKTVGDKEAANELKKLRKQNN